MRSIYGFILLSSLLFTGVATTANRTLNSDSSEHFSSGTNSETFAQDNGNYCTPGESQREDCNRPQSQLLLASAESKPGMDQNRDRMPRGTGRRDSVDFGRGSGRISLKNDDGRGSGRVKLTNADEDADETSTNDEAHRASGRVEV